MKRTLLSKASPRIIFTRPSSVLVKQLRHYNYYIVPPTTTTTTTNSHVTTTFTTPSSTTLQDIHSIEQKQQREKLLALVIVFVLCSGVFVVLVANGQEGHVAKLLTPDEEDESRVSNLTERQKKLFNGLLRSVKTESFKQKGSIGLINITNRRQNWDLERAIILNQMNPNREVDLIYMDSSAEQARFKGRESDIDKMLTSIEWVSKYRQLKGPNRPIVLVYVNVHSFENDTLEIVKSYAQKWSNSDKKNVAIAFADLNLTGWKFKKDKTYQMQLSN
jgi:hypothetical protein